MVNLTFAEQVKIILGRRGMTIKQLAELVEQHTGKPMSRQNMTQRLGRDNFQEQDMRLIAESLGCELKLSIVEPTPEEAVSGKKAAEATSVMEGAAVESANQESTAMNDMAIEEENPLERELTIGEIVGEPEDAVSEARERELLKKGIGGYFKKAGHVDGKKQEVVGDINPYTGKEYKSNSVRIHPKRIGYVQVYDQEQHKWTDMTEWAFLGYQERKKVLLGKDYEPPIYLD